MAALFKKGDRCDANNYRPITVLPTISKILEKAVHTQLYAYLKNNGIFTSKQVYSAVLICIFLSQKSERDLWLIPGFA